MRDPGATRERVRAEAAGLGLGELLWLERVEVATRPAVDLAEWRAGSDAAATLLRSVEAEPTPQVTEAARSYAATMLDRAMRLREELGPEPRGGARGRRRHPASTWWSAPGTWCWRAWSSG